MLLNSVEFLIFLPIGVFIYWSFSKRLVFQNIFFHLLLFLLLSSCSSPCNGEQYRFRVRLEIISQYKDTISISYQSIKLREESKIEMVQTIVDKSIKGQFIEFCLPEEPIDLWFDFSNNPPNKKIKILSALFENNKRQMFIQNKNFHKYFKGNKFVKYNKEDLTYEFDVNNASENKASIKCRKPMNDRLKNNLKP